MRPSTRKEILGITAGTCDLLTDGFESRYGHLQVYKERAGDAFCVIKDLRSQNVRDFEQFSAYLQWKGVQTNKNISNLRNYSKQYDETNGVFSYTLSLDFYPVDLQQRIMKEVKQGAEVVFTYLELC